MTLKPLSKVKKMGNLCGYEGDITPWISCGTYVVVLYKIVWKEVEESLCKLYPTVAQTCQIVHCSFLRDHFVFCYININ